MIGRGLLVAAALSALPLSAWADDQPQPLEAGKENTGRVSVVTGTELFGRGPYDDETWELSINAVVREGDELFTEDGTYAELEMPGQIFVRLDGDTTVVLQRVSDQGIELALASGSVYVSRGSSAQPVMVQTFGGAVELGGNSMARVGCDNAKTKIDVKVVKGSAELRSEKTAIAVPAGKTLAWTRAGSRNDTSAAFDDFDRWNETRENTVRGISRPEHVAANAMGSYELDGAGTWVMIDGYYAWRPTVVAVDWRPYSNGYWTWTEPWGWTWCDYYGWGYTTSHYGRWYHRSSYGWVWYPDPYWGASWVVWAAFGPHIGWAPCDYWGRPIYVYSYYSYYDYGAWCYSDADYFYTGGGYHPRGVRTSTSRTARMGVGGRSTSVGRSGTHSIRTFDQNTIRQYSPVPVRDASRELTPKHVVAAAERGVIKGVRADQRKGDFLARAVKEGGVRPEPWADRGRGAGGTVNNRGGDSRGTSPAGDRSGRDPVRSAEGWGAPDRANSDRSNDRTGSNDRGANTNSNTNDRGGNNGLTAPSRSDTHDRGGSTPNRNDAQDRGWTPPARNDSQPSYTPPARNEPTYTPPARNDNSNNNSRPAPQPAPKPAPQPAPRQDNDGGKKSNDSKSNDKKPRSGWSNTTASKGYSYDSRDGSSRATSSYTYNEPRKSKKSSSASSAPSYSAPSRSSSGSSKKSSGPSYNAPSRSSGGSSSKSAPSYSAPSRSSGGSSKSYSAPKSSGGSSKSSGSSSKSSGGSSKSSSSSSSSSSSKSSGKRK